MTHDRRFGPGVIVGVVVFGSLMIAILANFPAARCARTQHKILEAGAYRDVPQRAWDAAQLMCERNNNKADLNPN
jgi:hypothetical protein